MYTVNEEGRRPLKSREWPLASFLTRLLVRACITPNMISVFGMLFGILAGLSFWGTQHSGGAMFILGAVGIQLRLLCNLLDGMVAVQANTASKVGELYNEVPDRISDAAIFIGLGFALNSSPNLGTIAAACAIFVAYARAFGASLHLGQDFCGPMAKPQRMFFATLIAIIAAAIPNQPICQIGLIIISLGSALTGFRRIFRIHHKLQGAN